MYRKIFIAGLLGLGLLAPLALTSSAEAYGYYRRHVVVVRPGPIYPAYPVYRPVVPVVGVGVYPPAVVYPRPAVYPSVGVYPPYRPIYR